MKRILSLIILMLILWITAIVLEVNNDDKTTIKTDCYDIRHNKIDGLTCSEIKTHTSKTQYLLLSSGVICGISAIYFAVRVKNEKK